MRIDWYLKYPYYTWPAVAIASDECDAAVLQSDTTTMSPPLAQTSELSAKPCIFSLARDTCKQDNS